jgi:hypothetical protein
MKPITRTRFPFRNVLRSFVRGIKIKLQAWRYRNLPVRDIFERIYETAAWGKGMRYNSGSGSSGVSVDQYVTLIKSYIDAHGIKAIVDLGCGDFRVGERITSGGGITYCGIDVVRPLIHDLNERHGAPGIEFLCRDIIEDELPKGDLYLVRQVFQHLNNAQIQRILTKLKYEHVIVTEHLPLEAVFKPNLDKTTGPDVRLYYGSGVFLEHPPFGRELTTLLEISVEFDGKPSVLRTSLVLPSSK